MKESVSVNQEDSEDEVALSSDTLKALEEFYKEQEEQNKLVEELQSDSSIVSFQENWQLSQFWYNDETIHVLSDEAVRAAGPDGYLALISCPSLYHNIKHHPAFANGRVVLFEFDKRFSVYGSDFVPYDYNTPLEVPDKLEKSFDIVVTDPPFLSEECLEKTSRTVKFLAKEKIILCTGSVMESEAKKLLDVTKTDFEPRHRNNLANLFSCFSNFKLTCSNIS